MRAIGKTHKGKVRSMNQDSFFVSSEPVGNLPNLYIVADGMGGHNAGELASACAVEEFVSYIKNHTLGSIEEVFREGIKYINDFIFQKAQESESYQGMGTTFIVCTIQEGKAYVGNVGDSRLYMLNDRITQVTRDHSLIEEMIEKGQIQRGQASDYPKNIITRAIGVDRAIESDFFQLMLENGEYILLCSDGLTNMLEDDTILYVVKSEETLEVKVNSLINLALEGGGTDNVTAILIQGE